MAYFFKVIRIIASISFSILLVISVVGYCRSQSDSSASVNAWTLEESGTIHDFNIDTTLNAGFQSYPWYHTSALGWNGNTWSPVYPLYFSPRYSDEGETKDWLKYYPSSYNNIYFNSRRPFTLLTFNNNAKKSMPEQNLEFLHTQNINPWFNFGLTGNFASSAGMYQHQQNRQSNLRLFSSYTSPRHTGYISYNFGKAQLQENGGISELSYYKDSLLPPENVPVNLTGAINTLKHRSLFVKQEHVIARASQIDSSSNCYPWAFSVGANFRFNRMRHLYTDGKTDFYPNIYIDTATTNDSMQISKYESMAYFKLDLRRKFGFYSGGFFERRDYGVLENHLRHEAKGISSGVYMHLNKFNADIESHQHFSGEEILNHLHSHFTYDFSEGGPELWLEAFYTENHPRFYDTYYVSNNFFWKTNFKDITDAGVKIGTEIPYIRGGVSFTAQQVTNAVYYDSIAMPVQNPDAIVYTSAKFSFTINAGNFRWTPLFIYQNISSDIMPGIPSIITVQHFSYTNRVFKVLDVQCGTEIYYSDSYFGPAYMPATMVYYFQNSQKTGGYPVADVFLNFKLKRARFFFKVNHVNDRLMKRDNFLVAGYPLPDRHFIMGISWAFYN